jgi:putative ABC transport system ATP-binding protein
MTALPLLQAEDVGRRYGERWLFRHLELGLARGERVALLGESGTGKSTLLNLIAGLDRCDEGRIALDGTRVDTLDADACARFRRRTIGFVFQAFHLLPHLSAVRNVTVPLLLDGRPLREALGLAHEALDRVGLAARADALPSTLSGGEQQRVALVRALVHRPALVLADEPTGNLDPATAAVALDMIEREVTASGAALLMVTHSAQAAAIATRCLRLAPDGLSTAP